MALLDVKNCRDIRCKYIHEEYICPGDWFDDEMCAECTHPDAKGKPIIRDGKVKFYYKGLGCSRDRGYLDIPDWCPLRKDKS